MSYYCCSVTKPCPVFCDPMDCAHRAPLVLPSSLNLLKFMSIESVMLSNHVILWCPLLWLFQSSSIEVFPVNQLFASGGQSIGASISASASVLPKNIQDCFHLGLTGLISLQSRDSQESSPTPLGWPRGMVQGGRWEEGSGWETRVYPCWIHVDVWQNQYNIVK